MYFPSRNNTLCGLESVDAQERPTMIGEAQEGLRLQESLKHQVLSAGHDCGLKRWVQTQSLSEFWCAGAATDGLQDDQGLWMNLHRRTSVF